MKKILFIAFILIFIGYATSYYYIRWTPSEEENYYFNQAIVAGEDFNLHLEQRQSLISITTDNNAWSWGAYAEDWSRLSDCAGNGDLNFFSIPLESGCTLNSYFAQNEYSDSYVWPNYWYNSKHTLDMNLNCDPGDYTIKPWYYQCNTDGDKVWGPWPRPIPTFRFKVLPGVDTPPFYDYNLFWAKIKETKRHYIHAYDVNEGFDGNYFIKAFEVKVDPDCTIIGGGAKDLTKQNEKGSWYKTYVNGSQSHAKFELLKKSRSFKEGVAGYSGCEDTIIKSGTPYQNYGNDPANAIDKTDKHTLIRFKKLGIPLGSIIEKATLDMYAYLAPSNTAQISAYQLWKYDWKEKGINSYTGATWTHWNATAYGVGEAWAALGAANASDTPDSWNTSNGTDPDRTLTAEDTITITSQAGWWSQFSPTGPLDVTGSLQSQLDNNKWGGWLIKETGNDVIVFNASCDWGIANERPILNVLWEEPPHTVNAGDYNNLNLYVDVQCDGWGYKDFNVTIIDADNHSTDLNIFILDLNAYKIQSGSAIPNEGPPGFNAGGSYYMGNNGFVSGEAFGVIDYENDVNHFVVDANTLWKICKDPFNVLCFAPSPMSDPYIDGNCIITNNYVGADSNTYLTLDYNSLIGGGSAGGVIQYIYDEEGVSCTTPGLRKAAFYGASTAGSTFLDIVDVYVLDIRADLNNPYYAVVDENSEIKAMAVDNDSIADINTARWHVYDDSCGEKTGNLLDNQTSIQIDKNVITTAVINCTTTGAKPINFFITTKKEDTGEPLWYASFRGDTYLYVILPDSLRMDSFEVVPSKVKKGDNVDFVAVVKSKIGSENPVDLNVQVEFKVFDENGNLLDVLSSENVVNAGQQTEFRETFNTSNLKEKTAYRVTAVAYLLSGSGPIKDRDAINDVEERYFWVLESQNKLQELNEINVVMLLVTVALTTLILSGRKSVVV
jgi:hypothetical protein